MDVRVSGVRHRVPRHVVGGAMLFALAGGAASAQVGELFDVPAADLPGSVSEAAAADFDDDGDLDLAFAAEQLAVHAGAAGAAFTPAQVIELSIDMRGLAVADLDGDGDEDVAVSSDARI